MGARQGHRHQQVRALVSLWKHRTVGNMVGVAHSSTSAARENRAFIDDTAALEGNSLDVVRVDRERGDRDRIVLLRLVNDILLA